MVSNWQHFGKKLCPPLTSLERYKLKPCQGQLLLVGKTK
jgi:hypothetical protein